MKKSIKLLLLLVPLFSTTASAVSIPSEIYRPRGELIKAKKEGDGDFEVKYAVRNGNLHDLAQKATAHAKNRGFHLVKSKVKHNDIDLTFRRGGQKLEIDIERKYGYIEYKADLERKYY